MRRILVKLTVATCLGSLAFLLFGCAPTVVNTAPLEEIAANSKVSSIQGLSSSPYRLGAGDDIEIKFFFSPEMNERLIVAPDGTISMMFAPRVYAEGLTLDELTAVLKKNFAKHIKQPDMVIIIRGYASQRVFVAGEVSKPGPIQLIGAETILQILDEAGWVTPAGGTGNVILVRRDPDTGTKKIYTVNVDKLVVGADLSQDVMVQAGDVVLVPPSDSIAADRWIDQNIRQILPFSTGVSGSYFINSSTAGIVP